MANPSGKSNVRKQQIKELHGNYRHSRKQGRKQVARKGQPWMKSVQICEKAHPACRELRPHGGSSRRSAIKVKLFSKALSSSQQTYNGSAKVVVQEIQNSVAAAHVDSSRCIPLGKCPFQTLILTPLTCYNTGPSGTIYKIYKCWPLLLKMLSKFLQTLRIKNLEAGLWTLVEGCFVPKELNSTRLNQFQMIFLSDIDQKIFWSIITKRPNSLPANGFINPTIYKGGVQGYSGCLKHTAVVSQLIKEAKWNINTLSDIWLDLAKAYPRISHQMIGMAFDH